MARSRILVSACLLGRRVRYDGGARPIDDGQLWEWHAQHRLVPICPEVSGGLGVPRPAAEIAPGRAGDEVLAGQAKVITRENVDLTGFFIAGAQSALALAQAEGCRFALLTDGSPSCGSSYIYDGLFTGRRATGVGVTAALLRANGIAVFSETEVAALARAVGDC